MYIYIYIHTHTFSRFSRRDFPFFSFSRRFFPCFAFFSSRFPVLLVASFCFSRFFPSRFLVCLVAISNVYRFSAAKNLFPSSIVTFVLKNVLQIHREGNFLTRDFFETSKLKSYFFDFLFAKKRVHMFFLRALSVLFISISDICFLNIWKS